jgi:hypothetical protein
VGVHIDPLIELCQKEGVEIHQIKEKFGDLRFYVGPAPDHVHAAIVEAERKSYTICEVCGVSGKSRDGSWIKTLCDEHVRKTPASEISVSPKKNRWSR